MMEVDENNGDVVPFVGERSPPSCSEESCSGNRSKDDFHRPSTAVKFSIIIAMCVCYAATASMIVTPLLLQLRYQNLSLASSILPSSFRSQPLTKSRSATRQLVNGDLFQGYNCIGERMNHNQKMYANTFLCASSSSGEYYIFGMNSNGDLIWSDLTSGVKRIYFENTYDDSKSIYFMLTVHGRFRIYNSDSGKILWGKRPKSTYGNIGYAKCLEKYACPYLHQHAGGVCVINWIEENSNSWMQKNINKVYDFRERIEYF